MPRRREIAKREVPADPIYNSPLVTKFISTIMRGGKRSTAERIMYKALEIVKEKSRPTIRSRSSRRRSRT